MLHARPRTSLPVLAPPAEQPQAFGRVADLVAQIVRPAAEGVDVVEILMQALGQKKADDVEVFVVMGGQPARVLLGFRWRVRAAQRLGRIDIAPWAASMPGRRALGYDRGLHVTVVAHQVPHHFQQVGQRLHAVDEIARGDHAPADEIQRLPDVRRRVMEARFAGDFGVVQQLRIQLDRAVVGAAAEEIDDAAAAQHARAASLPDFRACRRLRWRCPRRGRRSVRDRLHAFRSARRRRSAHRRPAPRRDPVAS